MSGYDPRRAFWGGFCSVFTSFPPSRERGARPIGWPLGPDISKRAMASLLQDPTSLTTERLAQIEHQVDEARAEDLLRLDRSFRLSCLGQTVAVAYGAAMILAALILAQAELEALAFIPAIALPTTMIWAAVWQSRQPESQIERQDLLEC